MYGVDVIIVNVEIRFQHPMSIFLSASILYSLRQSVSLAKPVALSLSGLDDP